jgi:hypothetical protein
MSELRSLIDYLKMKVTQIEWNSLHKLDQEQTNELFDNAVKCSEKIYAQVSTLKSRHLEERKKTFLDDARLILNGQDTWRKHIMLGSSLISLFNKEDMPDEFESASILSDFVSLNLHSSLHWITPECKMVRVWTFSE